MRLALGPDDLGIQMGGTSRYVARVEYLKMLHLPRAAFDMLKAVVNEDDPVCRAENLAEWAADYGFFAPWLVAWLAENVELWRQSSTDPRDGWVALPPCPPPQSVRAILLQRKTAPVHFERPTEKRHLKEHLRWFILHQHNGLSLSEIARQVRRRSGPPTISAVSQAVANIAVLLDISPRTGRRQR